MAVDQCSPLTEEPPAGLRRSIGAPGFFALSFGAIVGSGWVVVLGDWLARGGPGGVVVGFLAGGAVMVMIGLCYAELAARMPTAGGEFLYAREVLGPGAGFAVGWFLTLKLIAICAFEGIALGVLLRQLLPGLGAGVLYSLLGQKITVLALVSGWSVALGVGALNVSGAKVAVRVQTIVTGVFIGVMALAIAAGLIHGRPANLRPVFPATPPLVWWRGALWVFSLSGMFLNGFQASLHGIEERREGTSLRRAGLAMVCAIAAAALFYSAVVIAAATASPWEQLIKVDLPAAAAFAHSLPLVNLAVVVLVAATLSLLKTWNAVAIMASRLIFAQARLGYLPRALAGVSARAGAPTRAIVLVTALTMLCIPFGRGLILPIMNMCAMCLAASYVMCVAILLRLRARPLANAAPPAFRVPGGRWLVWVSLVGAVVMSAAAILEPAFETGEIPLEWLWIAGWAACGAVVWIAVVRRRLHRKEISS
ncbi:MAG: APC family permease [Caulobacteraceae bacterium]|nr:APC family permease [Caulobacteraceae bacterium]